ncbi:MAG: glutamate racemase [Parachlamydia sp.]|nr:MAG: glutamate racemase [Parachlamydia sp.]
MTFLSSCQTSFPSVTEKIAHYPIGMFDSGVGGLTVMRELMALLPQESVNYFGDTAHFPYGSQSAETIVTYATAIANFLAEHSLKMLVIACNTASAYALSALQDRHPFPIIDVISSGVEKAALATKTGSIAVLGTKGTIRSGIYQQKLKERIPDAQVFALACPLLAPLVEEQFLDHPATTLIIREYLKRIEKESFDTILLGCTHYPFLKESIQAIVGEGIKIIDSASACAWKIKEELETRGQLNAQHQPSYHFYVSAEADDFQKTGELFLKKPLNQISLATPSSLHSTAALIYANKVC